MTTLDLSNSATCPKQFGFSAEYPKQTPTGIPFLSFEGLRLYLITGSLIPQYLTGNIAYTNQNQRPDYIYVPDLKEQLITALKLEVAKYPFLKMLYGPKTEVVWSKYGILPSEEEWVDVVRAALAK